MVILESGSVRYKYRYAYLFIVTRAENLCVVLCTLAQQYCCTQQYIHLCGS